MEPGDSSNSHAKDKNKQTKAKLLHPWPTRVKTQGGWETGASSQLQQSGEVTSETPSRVRVGCGTSLLGPPPAGVPRMVRQRGATRGPGG